MTYRLFADWIAVDWRPDEPSGRATVLAVGESISEVGPDDEVIVDPDAGIRVMINGRMHRFIDRGSLIGVVDADDDGLDDDMRPRYPADDGDEEGEAADA